MEFEFYGCKIKVFPSFMIMICFVLLIDKTGIMLFSLLSALIHEIGHIVFIIFTKKKISKIIFQIGGIVIDSKGVANYKNEFLIALGGCFFNFIFFVLSFLIFVYTKYEIYLMFSATNLGLLLFNLMPVENLDGMDLLKILLNKYSKIKVITNYYFIFVFAICNFNFNIFYK